MFELFFESCSCNTPPWPVDLGVGLAPTPHKNLSATVTTARELSSPGRRSEADHANDYMKAVDQSREDISISIADLLSSDESRILECEKTFSDRKAGLGNT